MTSFQSIALLLIINIIYDDLNIYTTIFNRDNKQGWLFHLEMCFHHSRRRKINLSIFIESMLIGSADISLDPVAHTIEKNKINEVAREIHINRSKQKHFYLLDRVNILSLVAYIRRDTVQG
jgi:hypothetical protein